jgi:hypothetical protein
MVEENTHEGVGEAAVAQGCGTGIRRGSATVGLGDAGNDHRPVRAARYLIDTVAALDERSVEFRSK